MKFKELDLVMSIYMEGMLHSIFAESLFFLVIQRDRYTSKHRASKMKFRKELDLFMSIYMEGMPYSIFVEYLNLTC